MNTRAIFIRCLLIYLTFLAIALIPFNVVRGLEYRNLIPGTNCQVLEVHNCEIVLGAESYYDCILLVNCYNTNMTFNIRLDKIPIANITNKVYNDYDDAKIYKYTADFYVFNIIMVAGLIPFVFSPLIFHIYNRLDMANSVLHQNKYEEDEI